MAEKLLFLTGHLAEQRVAQTVETLGLPQGSWRVQNIGIKVAALMTEAIVRNRLKGPIGADRVILPGRCRMDLAGLSDHYGVPFERGPDEIVDLPQFFGRGGRPPDFSRHNIRIFAEIVEAPTISIEALVARALVHRAAGADVIDIGCQPDVDFPGLENAIAALHAEGLKVSVDSGNIEELRRAANAGADYVLSLDETTLDVVGGTGCVPILVPKPHGDLDSLLRAIEKAKAKKISHIVDPVLDPIHFGFMASLERYAELRRRCPDAEILMGTGNLTELTDADSQGVTATLIGICSELRIENVLVVQVSPHTMRTVYEHDAARRLMFRAHEDASLPKGYGGGLLSLHEVKPCPLTPDEIAREAQGVRDANFRIHAAEDGIHIYNRDGHHVATDPFEFFSKLDVEKDGSHAFYLGYELAKAEIARSLGKRYAQDNPLDWGVAADKKSEDLIRHAPEGATLKAAKEAKSRAARERTDAKNRRDDRNDDER
jgi:dihydropteroate synthase